MNLSSRSILFEKVVSLLATEQSAPLSDLIASKLEDIIDRAAGYYIKNEGGVVSIKSTIKAQTDTLVIIVRSSESEIILCNGQFIVIARYNPLDPNFNIHQIVKDTKNYMRQIERSVDETCQRLATGR